MGVLKIKATGKRVARERLMDQARERASSLLEENTDRVLVVYGQDGGASLYFESPAPAKS